MTSIGFNSYLDNYTSESNRSHFIGSREELLRRVRDVFDSPDSRALGLVKDGDVEGTLKVFIDPEGIFTPMVPLKTGDVVTGTFGPRFPGDTPALGGLTVKGQKTPATSAFVVLYPRDVLMADWERAVRNSNAVDGGDIPMSQYVSTDAEYEVACLQGNIGADEDPQNPVSLARNLMGLAGGSNVKVETLEEAKGLLFKLAHGVLFYATHAQTTGE